MPAENPAAYFHPSGVKKPGGPFSFLNDVSKKNRAVAILRTAALFSGFPA